MKENWHLLSGTFPQDRPLGVKVTPDKDAITDEMERGPEVVTGDKSGAVLPEVVEGLSHAMPAVVQLAQQ